MHWAKREKWRAELWQRTSLFFHTCGLQLAFGEFSETKNILRDGNDILNVEFQVAIDIAWNSWYVGKKNRTNQ